MKRKAILIGNSRGLTATPLDMANFAQFLMSHQGGAWEKCEINQWMDKDVNELLTDVQAVADEKNDYVIVYFTGHGGLQSDTIFEVNPQNEIIKENSLFGLADRQLNILDCCRVTLTTPLTIYGSSRSMSALEQQLFEDVRAEYDDMVMNAAPQLVRLYSCSEGESSYPSSNGSYYTNNLISCAKELLKTNNVVTVHQCHIVAGQKTAADVLDDLKMSQHPTIIPAKCLAQAELPFCFNPASLK